MNVVRAVVADTGPLNYLVLINAIEALPRLFEVVFIPEAVRTELDHLETPQVVRRWLQSSPTWLKVHALPQEIQAFDKPNLDAGEAAVLALATQLHADLLLMITCRSAPDG